MITVLLPTYNCGEYIGNAIKSILLQTYSEYEFLIIDDGSADFTERVIREMNDPRIRYIYKEHSGIGDTLNFGLKKASHEMIARMDADDIAHPQRLFKQLRFYRQHPDIDILSCNYAVFEENKIKFIVEQPSLHEDIYKNLALFPRICHPGVMYKRDKILSSGGYNDKLLYGEEDYELWIRIKDEVKIFTMPEVLMFLRYRKDSVSLKDSRKSFASIYKIQEKYYNSDLMNQFNIDNKNDENAVRGWREYYFGNKQLARKYWFMNRTPRNWNSSLILGFILSFIPGKIYFLLRGKRLIQRFQYKLHPLKYKTVKKEFASLIA